MNIGFVGLGKLGLPVSVAIAEKGHVVRGYDANAETLARYKTGVTGLYEPGLDARMGIVRARRQLRFCSLAEVVAGSEIIFVAVQTPHPPELDGSVRFNHARLDFDYSFLVRSCEEIARELLHCHGHKTVVVMSTVLPGTTRDRIYPAMSAICDDENWTLLYNPSFIAMGTVLRDYVNPEFSLIGVNQGSADPLVSFYRSIHRAPALVMSWEEAELTKVTYNTFIGLKIVYANTVMQMCHEVGADCDVVLGALKQAKDRLISPKYLAGGMGDAGGCFPAGQIVITANGPRPIEDIKAGDFVLTAGGTLGLVHKTWKRDYDGDLIKVTVQGLPETMMTADHPMLVRLDQRKRRTDGRKQTDKFPVSGTYEIRADQLSRDHLICWPKPIESDGTLPEHATPEYLELAGWYLAEGSMQLEGRSGRLRFDLHAREQLEGQRIGELLTACAPPRVGLRGANACLTIKTEGNSQSIRMGSLGLTQHLYDDFGKGAAEKLLPSWVLWGSDETARLVLSGMIKGDGFICGRGINYSTVSRDLAWGAMVLMSKLGCHPAMRIIPARPGHRLSYEVRVRNRREATGLASQLGIAGVTRGTVDVRSDDWRPVRRISRQPYKGLVYNLWVMGSHTYVTSCGAVHNCHPRDNIAMARLSDRCECSYNLFDALMTIREQQAEWLATMMSEDAPSGWPRLILGKTFKPHTNLTVGSCSILVGNILRERGCEAIYWDPEVEPAWPVLDGPVVALVATCWPEVKQAVMKLPAGSIVVDPWGFIEAVPEGVELIRVGRRPLPVLEVSRA